MTPAATSLSLHDMLLGDHEQAELIDKQIASHGANAIGPLAGVPIVVKVLHLHGRPYSVLVRNHQNVLHRTIYAQQDWTLQQAAGYCKVPALEMYA